MKRTRPWKIGVLLFFFWLLFQGGESIGSSQYFEVNNELVSGDDGNDLGYDIHQFAGNTIVVGWNNAPGGSIDVFISVLNDGVEVRTNYGGSQNDIPYSSAMDSLGNIVIGGLTSSVDFPIVDGYDSSFEVTEEESNGKTVDAFLMKVTLKGEIVWSTFLGGLGNDYITGVAVDSQDNIIVSGFTGSKSSIQLRYFTPYQGSGDGFLLKYTPTGQKVWGKYIGGAHEDIVYGIDVDDTDNIVISGFSYSENFKESKSPENQRVVFVQKSAPSGKLIWQHSISTTVEPEGEGTVDLRRYRKYIGLDISSSGDIAIGYSEFTNHGNDISILKYGSTGLQIWNRTLTTSGNDYVSVVSFEGENVLVAGSTNSVNFPTFQAISYVLQGGFDAYLMKFDPTGGLTWSTLLGGELDDTIMGISQTSSNSMKLTGFSSSLQFSLLGSDVDGITDFFVLSLKYIGEGIPDKGTPSQIIDTLVDSTSQFEIMMIGFGALYVLRSFDYFRKTKIVEYIVFAGIFITMILASYLSQIISLLKIQKIYNSPVFSLPSMSLTVTWIFLMVHAIRLKGFSSQRKISGVGMFLFLIKILSTILMIYLQIETLFRSDLYQTAFLLLLIAMFSIFDIFIIFILIYSYFTVKLFYPTFRIKISLVLWRLTWIFLSLGYLLILVNGSLHIILYSQLEISDSLSLPVSRELFFILSRRLNLIFDMGIIFFLVIVTIGVISILLPEGILLSQSQIALALRLYPFQQDREEEPTPSTLDNYIQNAKQLYDSIQLDD